MPRSSARHVAVVGGGIVGCATAYRLARSGLRVTLIERHAVAAHASGHNAGNLNPLHGTAPSLVPTTLEAFALQQEIVRDLAQLDCSAFSIATAPRIHLLRSESGRKELEELAGIYNSHPGFSARWLDRDDLRRLEPGLSHESFSFGLLTDGGMSVDSGDYARSMLAAAQRFGTVVVRDSAVSIASSGGRITAIKTGSGCIDCDEAAFATGPWVSDVSEWLGVRLAIEPVKGELLLLRIGNAALNHDLCWEQCALYRRRDDQVWIGGTMDRQGFDTTPSRKTRQILLERAADILPGIAQCELLDHVAALRPMPDSGWPLSCRAAGWDNAYIANGGGTKGVLLSAIIARRVCDLIIGYQDAASNGFRVSPKEQHGAPSLS